jgi:hypothetical protein
MKHYLYLADGELTFIRFNVTEDVTITLFNKLPNHDLELLNSFTVNMGDARKKYKKYLKNNYKKPNDRQLNAIEHTIDDLEGLESAYPKPTNTKTINV